MRSLVWREIVEHVLPGTLKLIGVLYFLGACWSLWHGLWNTFAEQLSFAGAVALVSIAMRMASSNRTKPSVLFCVMISAVLLSCIAGWLVGRLSGGTDWAERLPCFGALVESERVDQFRRTSERYKAWLANPNNPDHIYNHPILEGRKEDDERELREYRAKHGTPGMEPVKSAE